VSRNYRDFRNALLIASAVWALLFVAVLGYFGLRPYVVDDCAGFQGICEPAERLALAGMVSLALLFAGAVRVIWLGRGDVLIAGWTVAFLLNVADGMLLFIPAVQRWEGVGPVQDVAHSLSFIFVRPIVLGIVAGLVVAVTAELPFGARKGTTDTQT
jgi:hypothetical protein